MKKKIKEKNSIKKSTKKTGKIAYTLIGAFLVPVVLIIILGVLSYQTASKNIKNQYQQSVASAVDTVSEYCHLLCNTIENKVTEIVSNDIFTSYYAKYAGTTDSEAMGVMRDAQVLLTAAKGTCSYIYSYNVISEKGGNITSASGIIPETAYDDFIKTKEAQRITGVQGVWSGYHTFLDDTLNIPKESYGMSYTKALVKGEGYITFDITYSEISNMLDGINEGKGSFSALVTTDDREVIVADDDTLASLAEDETVFVGTDYIETAFASDEPGSTYVTFHGKSYLFSYAQVGETGMLICSLIPKSTILASASGIRNVTIIIVLFASVIALIIGTIIARNISAEVQNLTKSMTKVSNGDFTTIFRSHRKDEFMQLTIGMSDMLANIRTIIERMKNFSTQVSNSAEGVSSTAGSMAESMENINIAMEEVAQGVTHQAEDTEHSLIKMSDFSDQLNKVSNDTLHMESSSDSAMQAVEQGRTRIQELNEKSKAASEMTKILVTDIEEVDAHSNNIGSIVETINAIAEQTNLLSLNASIEAARAGEAGRGFSVVAEEIRNLAEQSSQAGNQIRSIVGTIQNKTQQTSTCAQQTEVFLQEQSDSIEGTIKAFGVIARDVEDMVTILKVVTENMKSMVIDKDGVFESIQSIATVSQEAAASTEEVTATVTAQLEDANKLAKEAQNLSIDVQELNDSMSKFIV